MIEWVQWRQTEVKEINFQYQSASWRPVTKIGTTNMDLSRKYPAYNCNIRILSLENIPGSSISWQGNFVGSFNRQTFMNMRFVNAGSLKNLPVPITR
jgi:hypothetical protein